MPARTPDEANLMIVAAYNAADADAVIAMYEPDAVYVNEDGSTAIGLAAIRENLIPQLAPRATFKSEIVNTIVRGDIAFVTSRWNATWTEADGQQRTAADQTVEVLRRQADGGWLYVIDAGQASKWYRTAS